MTYCPSEAMLRSVGTEAIGHDTFAGLEKHVEECVDCQQILEATTKAASRSIRPPTLPGLMIERELGRGGTSVVYLAWEPALNRHVALKLIPRNSLVDPHVREHWIAEARALSRVPHEHVVAIHRVDETEEWLCLVLEYVSGGTLKNRLTEPLPPRDAARLLETIARTVGYFHARGLAHLDLKPSNILLKGEMGALWEEVSPKISDFGIARLEGEPGTTETGANGPKGTPSYMAPEQVAALRGTIGPAADIHALGALLYHSLTGRPPYQGASNVETLDQVRNQEPVPPRRLNARIPRDLETIALKCLEKAPEGRYKSAEALADDLHHWLEDRPIMARRVSPIGNAWRFCRRHRAVAALLCTLVMTILTGVIGLFVLLNQAEAERARLAEARRKAEAYEQFSASTAEQIGTILRRTLRQHRTTTPERMTDSLLKLRKSTIELRSQGVVPFRTIGILEQEIGWALMSFNKMEEARDLLNQAIVDLKQSLLTNPKDNESRLYLCEALLTSGNLADEAGELEAALTHYEQSADATMASDPTHETFIILTGLYKKLQGLADRLGRSSERGQKERARQIGQQILHHLRGSDRASQKGDAVVGLNTLVRLFYRSDVKELSTHEDTEIRSDYEGFVADWLALSVVSMSPFRTSSCIATYDRNPDAGAFALISAIRELCLKLEVPDALVPAAIKFVSDDAVNVAIEQRKLGRLDEAHSTAARLMALARQLVREYPESWRSYRVLSEAHNQIKKNAFRSGDDKLVEESIVEAIKAAQRALDLDPGQIETRNHLAYLNDQLASMRADGSAAVSSHP